MADGIVVRALYGDEVTLCVADGFVDRKRSVSTLADTNTDASLAIANDDDEVEISSYGIISQQYGMILVSDEFAKGSKQI